jgi:hypothetical protein
VDASVAGASSDPPGRSRTSATGSRGCSASPATVFVHRWWPSSLARHLVLEMEAPLRRWRGPAACVRSPDPATAITRVAERHGLAIGSVAGKDASCSDVGPERDARPQRSRDLNRGFARDRCDGCRRARARSCVRPTTSSPPVRSRRHTGWPQDPTNAVPQGWRRRRRRATRTLTTPRRPGPRGGRQSPMTAPRDRRRCER